jgi:diguanylate cyclase (GGDEF)-like protein/PAS domain S-box-containing protein
MGEQSQFKGGRSGRHPLAPSVPQDLGGSARGARGTYHPTLRAIVTGPLLILVIVAVSLGGLGASYWFSQSAERANALAINAFDLRGDLGEIAIDLSLPPAQWTPHIRSDLASSIAGAQQEIREMRAAGGITPLLARAIQDSNLYLDDAERQVAGAQPVQSGPSTGTQLTVSSPDVVQHLVDQAATEVQQSAVRAARNGRLGGVAALLGVVLIVTVGLIFRQRERERRRQELSASEAETRAQFEAMVEHSTDLFFLTKEGNRVQYCSPSAARFLGVPAAEMSESPLEDLVHPEDVGRASDAFAVVKSTGAVGPFDLRVRHSDGGWRTLEFTGNDLSMESTVQAVAWHTRDVTDRRALEEQLARQAFEDPLTGLANGALFRNRLGHALARVSRSRSLFAVLMIDLDGFKAINDSKGRDAGDDALKEIAARISRSVRPGDTVARLGGDEFTVLLEEIDDVTLADEVADRILDLIRQPFTVHNVSVRISASIGIVISGASEMTQESLLRDADVAMYSAKTNGRDRRSHFEPAMHVRATQKLEMSQDLAHALDREELVVYYQPSVDLNDWRPEGVEALLRWNHPELGLVSPDIFIPLAEQNGLIVPIGRWVLEQACQQAVAWRSEFPPDHALTMSVNVSGRQLNHESLIPDVRSILSASGLDPGDLTLEITETVLMSDIDLVVERLGQLKELGISIAIDDFGTGYSSLAYLRQLPIDILKIDKTFVDAASAGDPGGEAIMRAILDLSEGMNLKTIAEGIEDASQALQLKELGCRSAQGFLFSRPMPPGELREYFTSNVWDGRSLAIGR